MIMKLRWISRSLARNGGGTAINFIIWKEKLLAADKYFQPMSNNESIVYQNVSNRLPDKGARGQSMDVKAADIDGDLDLDIILANDNRYV